MHSEKNAQGERAGIDRPRRSLRHAITDTVLWIIVPIAIFLAFALLNWPD